MCVSTGETNSTGSHPWTRMPRLYRLREAWRCRKQGSLSTRRPVRSKVDLRLCITVFSFPFMHHGKQSAVQKQLLTSGRLRVSKKNRNSTQKFHFTNGRPIASRWRPALRSWVRQSTPLLLLHLPRHHQQSSPHLVSHNRSRDGSSSPLSVSWRCAWSTSYFRF